MGGETLARPYTVIFMISLAHKWHIKTLFSKTLSFIEFTEKMNKSTTWNLFVLYHKKTKENVDGEVTVCVIDIRSILGDPGAVSRFQVRAEEPLGTLSYKTSSKRSQSFWYLIDARKSLCFSAQSE